MVLASRALRTAIGGLVIASARAVTLSSQQLTVSRASTVRLNERNVDDILFDANEALLYQDTAHDVSCHTIFAREGEIRIFPSPTKVLSPDDYRDVCAQEGRVHVVEDIQSCNGKPCTNCTGCSNRPGTCMVLVRPLANAKEGVLWAHEYGHNVGLCDVLDATRVMKQSLSVDNKVVNNTECDAYLRTPAAIATCPIEHEPDLQTFLRRHYTHGTPYEAARRYGREHIPELLRTLRDPAAAAYRSNVVLTLGIIGDPAAIAPLQRVIHAPTRRVSRGVLVVRRSAVVALGYLYLRSQNPDALRYLLDGVSPRAWSTRLDGSRSLSRALALASIQALGVTGAKAAEEPLRGLSKMSDPVVAKIASEALRLNREVQTKGDAVLMP